MTSFFTCNFLKTALAVAIFTAACGNAMAQEKSMLRPGSKTVTVQNGSVAKINALVSKPGNSQDYIATGGGNWQIQTNSAYTYDSQGRLTERIYSDPATNQNVGREVWVYDAKGNETEYRAEAWQGTAWVIIDASKTQITYNSKGNKTEVIHQYWNNNTSTWENDFREEMVYDNNDLMTSLTNSEWNGNAWEMTDRMNLTHVGGVATGALGQEYNGSTWDDVYRVQGITWHKLYEIPSAYVMEIFDNNAWVKNEKYAAVYDANGGYIGTYEEWNTATNTWVNSSRETESYDNNKNFTGWKDESWNKANNTWELSGEQREVLTYSGIDVTQRIFQDSFNASAALEDTRKEVYSNFQTFNISGVKNLLAENAVNIFPNPATAVVNIVLPGNNGEAFMATISDVTGKTWLTKSFNPETDKQINIEALPKGIYLLQLQTESDFVVKRIVKQ